MPTLANWYAFSRGGINLIGIKGEFCLLQKAFTQIAIIADRIELMRDNSRFPVFVSGIAVFQIPQKHSYIDAAFVRLLGLACRNQCPWIAAPDSIHHVEAYDKDDSQQQTN